MESALDKAERELLGALHGVEGLLEIPKYLVIGGLVIMGLVVWKIADVGEAGAKVVSAYRK